MNDKQSVKIDGQEFPLDSLSENAKAQLMNMRLADQEIARLQMQLALAQTARNAYAQALKTELPDQGEN